MNVFKRNQVVITALVIMIAIAGYLNFTQKNVPNDSDVVTTTNNDIEEVGVLVPNSDSEIEASQSLDQEVEQTDASVQTTEEASTTNEPASTEPGEAVFTSNEMDITDYFIQAKLSREQVRAKRKEDLLLIIDNQNLTQEQKGDATKEMMDLQKRIEKEAAAEDMLKAKGFSDVFVRVNDNGEVDVVVSNSELSDADRAQIEDIVKRQTGVAADKIVITPLKLKK